MLKVNEPGIYTKVNVPAEFGLNNYVTNEGFQPVIMGDSVKPSVQRWVRIVASVKAHDNGRQPSTGGSYCLQEICA